MTGWVAATIKLVEPHPDVHPLTGRVREHEHGVDASGADRAALEWALRLGEQWGYQVLAVTAGPPEAEKLLREALAAGADHAVRVDLAPNPSSAAVAASMEPALAHCAAVCCGDYSQDRGSGAVPAFLAEQLGAAQALGLVSVAPEREPGRFEAQRRLDGGRRERLRVRAPAVLSVESGAARPRRAALAGVVRAREATIEVIPGEHAPAPSGAVAPYRPRPRSLPGPDPHLDPRSRIEALTGASIERTPPRVVTGPAERAADELLDFLRETGYLD